VAIANPLLGQELPNGGGGSPEVVVENFVINIHTNQVNADDVVREANRVLDRFKMR